MRKSGVQSLSGLLARYKTLRAPQGAVLEVFIQSVSEVCGFVLEKKHLTYKPGSKTIGLCFAGPKKTEIFLHKEEILRVCRKGLGETSAPKAIL